MEGPGRSEINQIVPQERAWLRACPPRGRAV